MIERGHDLPLASVTKDGGVEFRADLQIAVWNPGDDVSGYKRVLPNDFVIGLRSFQSGLGHSTIAGLVSPAYTVLRPVVPLAPGYYRHYFKSVEFISQLENLAQGIRQGRTISTEDFYDMRVPLPPIAEQRAIADFLDRETARIDALVSAKRRMIELLDEWRRTFVAQAVTRGRWEGADLLVTNNDFAPRIPRGWRLVRLKHVVHQIVDTAHKTAPVVDGGRYLVVRTSNVKGGRLVLTDARYTDESGFREWTERAVPRPGDIMFTREAPAGEACLVPGDLPVCIGQRMVLIQTDESRMLPEFGLHSLYGGAAQEFIRLLSRSTTVAHLNMADIPDIPIVLPSLDEQRSQVERITAETARLRRLDDALARQIDLLVEHRQALITAAVTGELDVPGVAA